MVAKLDPKKLEEEKKKRILKYTTTVVEMNTYYNFLYFMGGLVLLMAILVFFTDGLKKFWTLLTLFAISFIFAGAGLIWMFQDKEEKRKELEKIS